MKSLEALKAQTEEAQGRARGEARVAYIGALEGRVAELEDRLTDARESPPMPVGPDSAPPMPAEGSEWGFIERCCSEIELAQTGNQTRLAKKLYFQIRIQVNVWRMLRRVYEEVGDGGEWPNDFSSLGLDETHGTPVHKPEPAPTENGELPLTETVSGAEPAGLVKTKAPRDEVFEQLGGAEIAEQWKSETPPVAVPQ